MIEVKGLTKVYKDIDVETRALNNVSFTLPNKGLVFIVGKSGSGKSTLINMIGGLDDITEGQVIIDGFDLSKAKVHELDKFRNNYLGIIYQNYNLFNDETVFENVRESIDVISDNTETKAVSDIIDAVELTDKKFSYVKNLSGGQKQRVAIARALIKKPKLILADEPTGNLDSRTAKNIFEYLKNAAESCLVVVITHDMPSANEYADRIIEIADGEIVRDVTRNTSFETNLKHIKLADDQMITQKEIDELNKDLKALEYHATRKEDRFSNTTKEDEPSDIKYVPQKQKYRKLFSKSWKTLLRNKVSTIVTLAVCVVMISLMTVAAAFVSFDSKQAIDDVLNNYDINNLVIRKSYSETGSPTSLLKHAVFEITSKDEEYIENAGYKGKKYPIYTVDATCDNEYFCIHGTSGIRYETFYSRSPIGTVVCDEEYLHKTFGDFKVLAGSLFNCNDSGYTIVPDYIADSILFFMNKKSPDADDPYQNIVMQPIGDRITIGAVISTDYKEKYGSILGLVERIKKEPQHSGKLIKQLAGLEVFSHFLSDANSYLNYCYSLNPNYKDYVYQQYTHNYFLNTTYSVQQGGAQKSFDKEMPIGYVFDNLSGHDVIMDISEYNKAFGTNLESVNDPRFEEKDIYVTKYSNAEYESQTAVETIQLHVKELFDFEKNELAIFLISEELHQEIMDWDIFTYGWAFDDPTQCFDLYQKTYAKCFYNPVDCFKVIYDTVNIIALFGDIFNIILGALLIILTLIIIMHNFRIIRNETYRFGVLKSMGYQSRYLASILLLIDLFSVGLIFAFSILAGWGTTLGANKLIQLGFANYAHSQAYLSITMVSFNIIHVLIFSSILLGLLLVTSFIPFLVIRRIKPSKIIRAAE